MKGDHPYRTYVIIVLSGLLAIFFIALSFVTPVQQQTEFPDQTGIGPDEEMAASVQPTSNPGAPLQEPPGGGTGIPQVDAVIVAILSNDLAARLELVRFITLGCSMADGLGSVPSCEAGQVEGTPVEFLPLGGPGEGSSILAAEVDRALGFEATDLYAAYVVADDLPDQPDYPRGTYVLYFSTAGGAETTLLRIDKDGRIVRLDNLGRFPAADHFQQKAADLIDQPPETKIFSSEAVEILVYPPEMH